MAPTDEFGIEYDTDVEAALKDPKATILQKLLDYRDKRRAAIQKVEQDKLDKDKKNKKGFLSEMFSE